MHAAPLKSSMVSKGGFKNKEKIYKKETIKGVVGEGRSFKKNRIGNFHKAVSKFTVILESNGDTATNSERMLSKQGSYAQNYTLHTNVRKY